MIRGNDWKSIFEVAPDYESYEFTMLDYKTDRELIEKVWSWEGEVEGLKCADGKSALALPVFHVCQVPPVLTRWIDSQPSSNRLCLSASSHAAVC